jgi:Uncharacterized protein conserved in bacteria
MSISDAVTALTRFGLGPRPGEAGRISDDPRGFVLAQCGRPDGAVIDEAEIGPTGVLLDLARAKDGTVPEGLGERLANRLERVKPNDAGKFNARFAQQVLLVEIDLRIRRAFGTDDGLVERLVQFWSNHFAVAAGKNNKLEATAGAFERQAIRPHVLGRFSDMLLASTRHVAMLTYLDNIKSVGPNAKIAGRDPESGLNENLAREILELHTLGVDGGYSQADVTAFANALTGWTVSSQRGDEAAFRFVARNHEPGPVTVLGTVYDQQGEDQGLAILDDLAAHPATARHIARKLTRHFVGDAASEALIGRVAAAFADSGGDLAATTRALVEADEAWTSPPVKVLPPYDFLVATARATRWRPSVIEFNRIVRLLGHPVWDPVSPAGFSDKDDAWAAPDQLLERMDLCRHIAIVAEKVDGIRLVTRLYGEDASPETMQTVSRAESREQSVELLLMSPEFLRR